MQARIRVRRDSGEQNVFTVSSACDDHLSDDSYSVDFAEYMILCIRDWYVDCCGVSSDELTVERLD